MGILSRFFDDGGSDAVGYFLLLSSVVRAAFWWTDGRRLRSQRRPVGLVSRLVLFPVKSMAGIDVARLECATPGAHVGPFGDRDFMVTLGDEHKFVTARHEPQLYRIQPKISDGKFSLEAENMETLSIDLKDVEALNIIAYGIVHDNVKALGLDCGAKAGEWLSRFLKQPGYRLLYLSPSVEKRAIRNGTVKYAAWTSHVDLDNKMAYQDFSSYHILSESSVEDLNRHINDSSKSVSTDFFRPNIVVSGVSAYDEDNWTKVYIGDAEFTNVKLCSRCVMTTVNPKTSKLTDEPLKTLRKYRKLVPSFGDSPCFGVNLILDKPGTIKVGDTIHAVIGQPPKLAA